MNAINKPSKAINYPELEFVTQFVLGEGALSISPIGLFRSLAYLGFATPTVGKYLDSQILFESHHD